MKPINFPQSTKVLQRPSTMPESECQSLHVWCDGTQCVSCWKPSIKERLNILFGGKVWLGVLSGKTQPPVFVAGERVFTRIPFKLRVKAFFLMIGETIKEAFEKGKNGLKESDKRKHFIVGFILSLVIGALLKPWLGIITAILAAFGKEWWDSKGHGCVEKRDIAFTLYGAACAVPLSCLLNFLIVMLWRS